MRSGTSTLLWINDVVVIINLGYQPKDNYFPLKPFHYVNRLFLTDLRPPLPPPHLPLKRNPACREMAVSPSALCWSLCCRWCVCVFARVKHVGRKCLRAAPVNSSRPHCVAPLGSSQPSVDILWFSIFLPGPHESTLPHTNTHTHVLRMHQVS